MLPIVSWPLYVVANAFSGLVFAHESLKSNGCLYLKNALPFLGGDKMSPYALDFSSTFPSAVCFSSILRTFGPPVLRKMRCNTVAASCFM